MRGHAHEGDMYNAGGHTHTERHTHEGTLIWRKHTHQGDIYLPPISPNLFYTLNLYPRLTTPRLALHPLTYTLELPRPSPNLSSNFSAKLAANLQAVRFRRYAKEATAQSFTLGIQVEESRPSSQSTPSYLSQRMAKAKMVSKLFRVDGILLNWRCEWISYCITDYSQMANAIYLYLVAVVIWL